LKRAAALREHAAGVASFSLSRGRGMGKGDLIRPCEERFKAALDAASDEWSGSSGRPAIAAGNGNNIIYFKNYYD